MAGKAVSVNLTSYRDAPCYVFAIASALSSKESVVRQSVEAIMNDIRLRLGEVPDSAPVNGEGVLGIMSQIMNTDIIVLTTTLIDRVVHLVPVGQRDASLIVNSRRDVIFLLYTQQGGGHLESFPIGLNQVVATMALDGGRLFSKLPPVANNPLPPIEEQNPQQAPRSNRVTHPEGEIAPVTAEITIGGEGPLS